MVESGAIITRSGKEIKTRIDTVCLHGDTPEAVNIAKAIKGELEKSRKNIRKFES